MSKKHVWNLFWLGNHKVKLMSVYSNIKLSFMDTNIKKYNSSLTVDMKCKTLSTYDYISNIQAHSFFLRVLVRA